MKDSNARYLKDIKDRIKRYIYIDPEYANLLYCMNDGEDEQGEKEGEKEGKKGMKKEGKILRYTNKERNYYTKRWKYQRLIENRRERDGVIEIEKELSTNRKHAIKKSSRHTLKRRVK